MCHQPSGTWIRLCLCQTSDSHRAPLGLRKHRPLSLFFSDPSSHDKEEDLKLPAHSERRSGKDGKRLGFGVQRQILLASVSPSLKWEQW